MLLKTQQKNPTKKGATTELAIKADFKVTYFILS